jgi:hypothetical protein
MDSAAWLALTLFLLPATLSGRPLFQADFNQGDCLLANEHAHWASRDPRTRTSQDWDITSGSLFISDGTAWTGVPDDLPPGASSSSGNNSAVFRATTRRSDFKNVAVSFDLLNRSLTSTPSTPPNDWDGLHIFLRYQSEEWLYYASVNRRDNKVVIKKKVPGGPSNGGTYHNLTPLMDYSVPYGKWQKIRATVRNLSDGSVGIKLFADGKILLSAKDDGVGGKPIRSPGKVGIRGDNADLKFDNFIITTLKEK